MKFLILLPLLLIVVAVFIQQGDAGKKDEEKEKPADDDDDDEADAKPDPKKMFESFFSFGKNKAFKKFVKSGRKNLEKAGFAVPKKDSDSSESGEGKGKKGDDDEKKPAPKKAASGGPAVDFPLAAKSFAFYGKTYGCQKAKSYKAFLVSVKEGKTGDPKNLPDSPDEKWLKKIANTANEIETDGSAKTKTSDAEAKLKNLSPEQKTTLAEGEHQMPLPAEVWLQYIKTNGCADSTASKYDKFRELYTEAAKKAIDKGDTSKYNKEYYVNKAKTIASEMDD